MSIAKHMPADSATVAHFGCGGLRWQTCLHFARHLAAESACATFAAIPLNQELGSVSAKFAGMECIGLSK